MTLQIIIRVHVNLCAFSSYFRTLAPVCLVLIHRTLALNFSCFFFFFLQNRTGRNVSIGRVTDRNRSVMLMKVRSPVRQKTFLPKSTFCADGSVSYSVGTTPVYNRILGEMRAEAESNRGPSAYQPDTLPVGQTGSPPGRALRLHLVRSFCLMSSDAKEHIRDSYNCC